jgi:putative methyltransferase
LLKKKGIVIQSKSSCLPPFVLFQGMLHHMSEFGKFDIIDCCAAPGNKTIQLAEYIGSHGSILAFEKN